MPRECKLEPVPDKAMLAASRRALAKGDPRLGKGSAAAPPSSKRPVRKEFVLRPKEPLAPLKYFTDRRPVDGSRVTEYLRSRYEWLPGMRELCTELQGAGVPMAAMSNYPAPWAPLIEDAVNLSQLVPWAFVSGEVGLRKPSPEAYTAALEAVGRQADQVIFVDDNPANVDAARALGIEAIRFESAAALRPELQRAGVLPR